MEGLSREIRPMTGIVLAGGLSRRMGRDKASLPWGTSDLLHAVLERLIPVCSELIVVTNVPRRILLPEVITVADVFEQCGPLAGIHAGMKAAGCEACAVVACDMPFVKPAAVQYLEQAMAGYDAAVPWIDGYHPLFAVYRQSCLPFIEQMLAAGNLCVMSFYQFISIRQVSAEELRQYDPDLVSIRNLNTPADLLTGKNF